MGGGSWAVGGQSCGEKGGGAPWIASAEELLKHEVTQEAGADHPEVGWEDKEIVSKMVRASKPAKGNY